MPTTGRRAPTRARNNTPDAKLRRKAQAMSYLALEALAKILLGEAPEPVKLAAAREVLDRALGRPKLGGVGEAAEALTVVIKRFTDAPDPEAGEYEERA
jgi:hypothetical protein